MNRTYRRIDEDSEKTYLGFNQDFTHPSEIEFVVLVSVEGDIETWIIDSPQFVSELISFLADSDLPRN